MIEGEEACLAVLRFHGVGLNAGAHSPVLRNGPFIFLE